jgi:hypothetical protein
MKKLFLASYLLCTAFFSYPLFSMLPAVSAEQQVQNAGFLGGIPVYTLHEIASYLPLHDGCHVQQTCHYLHDNIPFNLLINALTQQRKGWQEDIINHRKKLRRLISMATTINLAFLGLTSSLTMLEQMRLIPESLYGLGSFGTACILPTYCLTSTTIAAPTIFIHQLWNRSSILKKARAADIILDDLNTIQEPSIDTNGQHFHFGEYSLANLWRIYRNRPWIDKLSALFEFPYACGEKIIALTEQKLIGNALPKTSKTNRS